MKTVSPNNLEALTNEIQIKGVSEVYDLAGLTELECKTFIQCAGLRQEDFINANLG